jgi:hypothetical protein
LEVDQGLETPLGYFCLIRRVGRVPSRILQYVPEHYSRYQRVIIAQSDKGFENLVFGGKLLEALKKFRFKLGCGEIERPLELYRLRDSLID